MTDKNKAIREAGVDASKIAPSDAEKIDRLSGEVRKVIGIYKPPRELSPKEQRRADVERIAELIFLRNPYEKYGKKRRADVAFERAEAFVYERDRRREDAGDE